MAVRLGWLSGKLAGKYSLLSDNLYCQISFTLRLSLLSYKVSCPKTLGCPPSWLSDKVDSQIRLANISMD